jgi:stage V sporulation protein R
MSKMLSGTPILTGNATIPGVKIHEEVKDLIPVIEKACRGMGLDYYPIIVEFMRYDEISELASYGGFPVRYPHWKWGMEYEELSRGYEFGRHRISEMVLNTDPCRIFCLDSNTLVDNIDVIAHAIGHNDFFKNNIFFAQTNRKMLDKLANHGTRIRKYMARWGSERVIEFIDHILRIETLIDPAKAWEKREIKDVVSRDQRSHYEPSRLTPQHNYMEDWVNPRDYKDDARRKAEEKEAAEYLDIFKQPDRDIFGYLKNNAPLKPWQQDIVAMLYDESMYFAPQRQTKMLNEGWACVLPGTLIFTSMGILPVEEIVHNKLSLQIDDTEQIRDISNWFEFQHKNTVIVETKRGYQIGGSDNHRIWDSKKEWVCLRNVDIGDKLTITPSNVWTEKHQEIHWRETDRLTYRQAKNILGKKYWRFCWYRCGKIGIEQAGPETIKLSKEFDRQVNAFGEIQPIRRKSIKIPSFVDEKFGYFLGYMIGDGHISIKKRTLGLTTGDIEQGDAYVDLVWELFGLKCNKKWDNSSLNGRWRINVNSLHLQDFLVHLGLKTGICAREKTIPKCILRSPKSVVSAFMRAYFDCDGYAGKAGVILSTASTGMGKQIQTVLLNYGILSTRRQQTDGCWHVRITGKSAIRFNDEIGFGLRRKQLSLEQYINSHKFFCEETWEDQVVDVKFGCGTVYDISVENTHRYAAHGFVNHNSYIDFCILCREGLVAAGQSSPDSGIWEYAHHKMLVLGGKYSQNPYKLGYELFLDIEDRWNKGKFGTEYEECKDMKAKAQWDQKLGLGKEKVFEVRRYYNDFTAITEFFTPEFCEEKQFYEYRKLPNGEWKIVSRDFKKIKQMLLRQRINGGLPDIRLVDPNHLNKGWFLLQHFTDGRPLYEPYARETMASIYRLWGKAVILSTKDIDDGELVFMCDHVDPAKIQILPREDYEKAFMG